MERRALSHMVLLPCILLVVLAASLVAASEVTPSPVAPVGFDHTLWTRVLQSYSSTGSLPRPTLRFVLLCRFPFALSPPPFYLNEFIIIFINP